MATVSHERRVPAVHPAARPPLIELILTGDWILPLRLSLLAGVLGLLMITVILSIAASSVFIVTAQVDDPGFGSAGSAVAPGFVEVARGTFFAVLTMWAGAHGAFGMTIVTATSCLWIVVSFVLAARVVKVGVRDRVEIFAIAMKAAVLYAGLSLAATLFIRATTVTSLAELIGGGGLPGAARQLGGLISPFGGVVKPFGAIAGGLILGFIGCIVALARSSGSTLTGLVGIARPSRTVTAALRGGREGLTALVLSTLIVTVIGAGTAVGLTGNEAGVSTSDVAGIGLAMLPVAMAFLLAFGIDIGLALGVFAMQFFSISTYLPAGLGSAARVPGWMYFALLIPAFAAYRGGMVAAGESGARDRSEAARAGATTALVAAGAMLIWSLMFFTRVGGEFVVTAPLLTLAWFAVFGTVGGFSHGRRTGLPERMVTPPTPSMPGSSLVANRPPPTSVLAPIVNGLQTPPRREPSFYPSTTVEITRDLDPPRESISELDAADHLDAPEEPKSIAEPTVDEPDAVEPSAPEPTDEVACNACGEPNPASSKFCGSCGTSTVLSHVCDGCGAVQPSELRFCRQCGTSLGQRR